MKTAVKKTLIKGVVTLAGILLIASALQFLVWSNREALVDDMLAMISGPIGADYVTIQSRLVDRLGFDHFFIPDLWPFDNLSIWRR